MRIESQPAYILHTRPFRDSSLLVDFLTADYGKISAVSKGVRASSKSARQKQGLTQVLHPLLISWSGKSELKTLTTIESRGMAIHLQGVRLFSALYINELLSRLLAPLDQHEQLFGLYDWALKSLQGEGDVEWLLRRFELSLMELLGYGLDFSVDSETGEPIEADHFYVLKDDAGFSRVDNPSGPKGTYSGAVLLQISDGEMTEQSRRTAKHICRQALKVHLGSKPLKSRELFS